MQNKKSLMGVLLLMLLLGTVIQAQTNLLPGGDVSSAGGWDNGKPAAGNPGTITVDGVTTVTTFGYGADGVINHLSGDIVCTGTNGFNMVQSGTWNMSGGSIIGRYILSNGQNGNCTFNFSGGKAILSDVDGTQHMGVANNGMMTVSGSFTVDGTQATVMVQATSGIINILPGWTGSWTWGTYSGLDWKAIVTAGEGNNGFRLDGEIIDEATFNATFQITNGGQTLSMIAVSAYQPDPANGQSDVLRDYDMSWKPGEYAVQHNVYVGDSFDDVNDATVPTGSGLDVNSFDPGRLELGKTVYWRVDEVNSTPDKTVFKGDVWSFTVEPYAIMIPVDVNHVTASSSAASNPPSMTVNGSGLDGNTHATETDTMWLSATGDLTPWLMFEFDNVQKLDQMLIWNSNSKSEGFIGWGIKDVNIETSLDGVDWTGLAQSSQIARAPGLDAYDHPQAVDLGLASAKYVRINILSNWGGLLQQYGVAEVQFYGLPVYARTPDPVSGSVDVLPNSTVSWRAGREAGQHTLYASTDAIAVADGTAPSASSSTHSLDLTALDLQLGQTYYWRVDEVNEAQVPSVWAGPVWSLSTPSAWVVDDFESYSNFSPNRPFQTWIDGYGYSADEFFPVDYAGNGTGSGVGHDIWGPGSPYFDGSIMETGIVRSGSKSMPVYYNNSAGGVSETTRKFADPQNWALYGIQGLKLWFYGDPANTTTRMYIKINNKRIDYPGDATDLQQKPWQPWTIDLTSLTGVNLASVNELTLGFEGGVGVVYIDDITLTPEGPDRVTPADPGNAGLVAHYGFEGSASDSAGTNHGTVTGAPQYVAGKNGQAIQLNGTDDFVMVEGSFLLPTYSVSLWFRSEDLSASADLLSLYSETGGHGILLELSAAGAIRYLHRFPFGTSGGNNVYSGPGYDDGVWYHVAAVKTEDTMNLYVNGREIGSVADSTQFTAVPKFTLGVLMDTNLQRFVMGEMDDVSLYDRALSQAEIAWLAGRTSPFDR
ncbi:MAG: discoidin domain-containing protein [Phycisphaerae bacterium]|nr:discoidin domain-containing protein [Phycisphaerae bacterium]